MSGRAPSPGREPRARHAGTAVELKARIEAERCGLAYLSLRDDAGRQLLHTLDPTRAPITLGRNPKNDLQLAWDVEVSGVHAELAHMRDEWVIVDNGLSRNGTFVNGEPVRGRQRLRRNDTLRLGRTLIVFNTPALDEHVPTTVPAAVEALGEIAGTPRLVLVALCRPCFENAHAAPAGNGAIAAEIGRQTRTVKDNLRELFVLFGIQDLPQNAKRSRLAQLALELGVVGARDYR